MDDYDLLLIALAWLMKKTGTTEFNVTREEWTAYLNSPDVQHIHTKDSDSQIDVKMVDGTGCETDQDDAIPVILVDMRQLLN